MQRPLTRRWFALGLPAVLFVLLLLALAFSSTIGRPASADPEQPDLPPAFTGEPVTGTLELPTNFSREIAVNLEESPVYTETFEAGLPANWLPIGDSYTQTVTMTETEIVTSTIGWATSTISNGTTITGTQSVWSIAGGDGPISNSYPANISTALLYGPLDLSNTQNAYIEFDYLLDVNLPISDVFSIYTGVPQVGSGSLALNGLATGLPTNEWVNRSYQLWPDYIGQDEVYIVFQFETGTAGNENLGALIDNFILYTEPFDNVYIPVVRHDPTPTPAPPTPTPTPPPGSLKYEFNSVAAVNEWKDDDNGQGHNRTLGVATTNIIELNVNPDIPLTNQSMLIEMREKDQFVIYSPLDEVTADSYLIDVTAFLNITTTDDEFGIVFAANWNTAEPCPNPDNDFLSCMNNFYVLRVRHITPKESIIEFGKVAGERDGNGNLGFEVLASTSVGFNTEGITTYRVEYDRSSGEMTAFKITQSDEELLLTAQDTQFADNNYFGMMLKTDPGNDLAKVIVDSYRITEQ